MSAGVEQTDGSQTEGTHRVLASCSFSKVFCLFSSSISVTVTSFSLGFDSAVVMGRVTPRYLEWWVVKGSAPDESNAQVVIPHGLSSCKAMVLGSAGGNVVFKVTSICGGADTTDKRSLPTCGHPQPDPPNPKRVHAHLFFSLSTGAGVMVIISQLHADSRLQVYLDSFPPSPVTDVT